MTDNVIKFPGSAKVGSNRRLMVYQIINEMLQAENEGVLWKADALFVQLGRKTGRGRMLNKAEADQAIVTARFNSVVSRLSEPK